MSAQIKLMVMVLISKLYTLACFFFFRNTLLRILGNTVGHHSYVHRGVKLTHYGHLVIGNHCTINYNCLLDTRVNIEIGNNVMIGHAVKIYTLGHCIDDPQFESRGKKVVIHDNVVVFPNSLIMPGVTLHEGAVVFPGAVVTKDVGPYEVVGGNPARFIRKRNPDIRYQLDYGYWFGN